MEEICETVAETRRLTRVSAVGLVTFTRVSVAVFSHIYPTFIIFSSISTILQQWENTAKDSKNRTLIATVSLMKLCLSKKSGRGRGRKEDALLYTIHSLSRQVEALQLEQTIWDKTKGGA